MLNSARIVARELLQHQPVLRGRPARRRAALLFMLVGWALLCGSLARPCVAQSEGFINREYPLKALFLYNFGGYVEWPSEAFADDKQPFVIGVLGNAPVNTMLHEIAASKSISGRRIQVKQFNSPESIEPCHILFVARNVDVNQTSQALDRLQGLPVLTVGEKAGFAQRGGCVNFFIEANKIRFEVNLQAAKQQHLRISAKLLALARIVQ